MITFYGKPDMGLNGKPRSEYPSWYFNNTLIDELERSIAIKRRQLEGVNIPGIGFKSVPHQHQTNLRSTLNAEVDRYQQILEAKPVVDAVTKDKLAKIYKDLGSDLRAIMPTRNASHKGLIDDHEESLKDTEPVMDVRGDRLELCKDAYFNIVDGRVSRNDASKLWKLLGSILGEPTNTEILRKD